MNKGEGTRNVSNQILANATYDDLRALAWNEETYPEFNPDITGIDGQENVVSETSYELDIDSCCYGEDN